MPNKSQTAISSNPRISIMVDQTVDGHAVQIVHTVSLELVIQDRGNSFLMAEIRKMLADMSQRLRLPTR